MQKTLAEVKGCPQKDRTESEGYVGAQTFMWICEDNIVEVPFDKEHLLERIISPDNLLKAYKAVQRNRGCSGIDKMSCEQMLPWLLANKDALIRSLLDGSYRPNPVKGRDTQRQWKDAPVGHPHGYRPSGSTSHQPDPNSHL